ncbi:MAG TPA: hypothetical protein VKH19_08390 [Gemmatimonadaceae bacterium]|nr:hypothetical protein [Gemmatimonadaceae bacterium]
MPQQDADRARAELNRLVARRDALRDQLESMTGRRGTLAQERLNAQARADAGGGAPDRAIVSEYEKRMNDLGQRMRSIEQELDKTEDAITDARAKLGDEEENPGRPSLPPVPGIPGFSPDIASQFMQIPGMREREALLRSKYQTMMIAEGATLLLLAVIGWRILWVSAKRRFARGVEGVPGMTDLRQSIDAIAVEVERISENQRYVTRMLTEGQAPAQRVDAAAKDSARRL